ncbi:MAG: amidohydrolase family protein [Planctomycetota bacterium]|jgi:guanine deaminase
MILQGRLLVDADRLPQPGWVAVRSGRIEALGHGAPPAPPAAGDADTIVCPGFVDAHVHLSQLDSAGCDAGDLLEWLDRVVFPVEMRWADPDAAGGLAGAALARLAGAGTLGLAGWLTSHPAGVEATLDAAARSRLRGVVGQVLMDRNAPAPLLGHAAAALDRPAGPARLALSVNPRFAVACTDALLAAAGRAAADGRFVQTHLSESRRECERVAALFPGDASYTAVYDRHGLLGPRTLLAHCVHLTGPEWDLIAEREAVVVHCPGANTFLASGLFDLDAARRHGVRLALGSDVAAGPDLAMPRVARAMIETAKTRTMTVAPGGHVPAPAEAWRLITRGNADALGLDDAGRLEAGAAADLLLLRVPLPVDEHLVGRLIHTWRDEYIDRRVVDGILVPAP